MSQLQMDTKLTCKAQLRRCRDVSAPQTDLQNQGSHEYLENHQNYHNNTTTQCCLLVLTFLFLPHLEFLSELRYNQKRLPSLTLLRLEDVAKDVVANVEDILPFDIQQFTDDVRRSCNQ